MCIINDGECMTCYY